MKVRPASIEDASEIAAVHVASWRAIYRGQLPDALLAGLDVAQRAAQWRRWLAEPALDCMVIGGDSVVGFCSVAPSSGPGDGPAGEITAIYLDPEHWRCGLGKRLISAASARAVERGYRTLSLWVLRENRRARSFYEAMGFSHDGRERIDSSPAEKSLHELRYLRSLAPAESTPPTG